MPAATAVASATNVQRLQDMLRYVAEGRILDAMNEFYAEDTEMQENGNPPTRGLLANIVREQEFLTSIAEFRKFEVGAIAGSGDTTFYESTMDYTSTDGVVHNGSQVAVARWRDGKIVHERFYYDSAAH